MKKTPNQTLDRMSTRKKTFSLEWVSAQSQLQAFMRAGIAPGNAGPRESQSLGL